MGNISNNNINGQRRHGIRHSHPPPPVPPLLEITPNRYVFAAAMPSPSPSPIPQPSTILSAPWVHSPPCTRNARSVRSPPPGGPPGGPLGRREVPNDAPTGSLCRAPEGGHYKE
ncbi:hypothetical protein OIU76_020986 [Salix suchowensis]|nr:hypothetical protein OIU76_020986 [Salix suchowensis]